MVFPFQDKNKPQRSAEQQRFVEDFLCSTRLPAQLSVEEFSFFSQEELVSHIAKTMRMKHDWFATNGKVIVLGEEQQNAIPHRLNGSDLFKHVIQLLQKFLDQRLDGNPKVRIQDEVDRIFWSSHDHEMVQLRQVIVAIVQLSRAQANV